MKSCLYLFLLISIAHCALSLLPSLKKANIQSFGYSELDVRNELQFTETNQILKDNNEINPVYTIFSNIWESYIVFKRKVLDHFLILVERIAEGVDHTREIIRSFVSALLPTLSVTASEVAINEDFKSEGSAVADIGWAGTAATQQEIEAIGLLRGYVHRETLMKNSSKWYHIVTDVELLRFLRARGGDLEDTWLMIAAHVEWRSTQHGADLALASTAFGQSPLHQEVFWLGINEDNFPTLVIRTQIHDGTYYNHDPKLYERYLYFSFLSQF